MARKQFEFLMKIAGSLDPSVNKATRGALASVQKISPELENFHRKATQIQDNMSKWGRRFMPATLALTGIGTAAIKMASDFESAFAWVEKTVDATKEGFVELSTGIREMSKEIPLSAVQISKLASAAGRLGIETDNILKFTRVIADLEATTGFGGEVGATTLARFANITQMYQGDFDRLGSTLIALGNNVAATEAEIAKMGMNLAAAGVQVGMSEPQILAMSGALSSLGLQAQGGGSAFSRLMLNMQVAVQTGNSDLQNFARVAGATSAQFVDLFQRDAVGAIEKFIRGIGEAENSAAILAEIGINEVLMRDAILRASEANELFSNTQKLANQAWDENSELARAAAIRYETFAAQVAILRNRMTDIGISFGNDLMPIFASGVSKIEKVVEWFGNLDEGQRKNMVRWGMLIAAIGPFLIISSKVVGAVKVVGTAFMAAKIGIQSYMTAVKASKAAMAGVTAAQRAFNAKGSAAQSAAIFAAHGKAAAAGAGKLAWGAMPLMAKIALPIAVVAGVVAGIRAISNAIDAARQRTLRFADSFQEAFNNYQKIAENTEQTRRLVDEYRHLNRAIRYVGENSEEYLQIQEQIAGLRGGLVDGTGVIVSQYEQMAGLSAETLYSMERQLEITREMARLELSSEKLTAQVELGRAVEERTRLEDAIGAGRLRQANLQAEYQRTQAAYLAARDSGANWFTMRNRRGEMGAARFASDENLERLQTKYAEFTTVNASIGLFIETIGRYYELSLGGTYEEMYEKARAYQSALKSLERAGMRNTDEAIRMRQTLNTLTPRLDDASRSFARIGTQLRYISQFSNMIPAVHRNTPNEALKIPMLASGGIVTRPTLAMVGEGGESEAVIPLSKLRSMTGGGMAVSMTNHFTINGTVTQAEARESVGLVRREFEKMLCEVERDRRRLVFA